MSSDDSDNESVCTAIQLVPVPDCGGKQSPSGDDGNEPVCPVVQVDREPRLMRFPDRERGVSPIPPPFFGRVALELVSMLWGRRLAMHMEPQERQSIFEGIYYDLTLDQHWLLCAMSWQFDSINTNLWEFYQFIFHPNLGFDPDLELDRDTIFRKVGVIYEGQFRQIRKVDEVSRSWDTLTKLIGDEIKLKLAAKQYPLCTCAIVQPHSFQSLESCIQSLKEFDSSKIVEMTQSAVVGHTSLRVLDMMNESNEQSLQHPLLQQCHDVFNNFLGQLKNRKDPVINEILEYEKNQQLKKDMDSITETIVGIRV